MSLHGIRKNIEELFQTSRKLIDLIKSVKSRIFAENALKRIEKGNIMEAKLFTINIHKEKKVINDNHKT